MKQNFQRIKNSALAAAGTLLSMRAPFAGQISALKFWSGANLTENAIFNIKINGVHRLAGGARLTVASGSSSGALSGLTLAFASGDRLEVTAETVGASGLPAPIELDLELDDLVASGISLPASLVGKNGYVPKINEYTGAFEWLPIGSTPLPPLDNTVITGLTNLQFWSAMREVSAVDGDAINPLTNQKPSGGASSLPKQSSFGSGATYKTDLIRPSLLYNGSKGYQSAQSLSNLISQTAYSIYAVIKPSAFKGASGYDHATIIGDSNGFFDFGIGSDGKLTVMHNGSTLIKLPTALVLNTLYLVEAHFEAGSVRLAATGIADADFSIANISNPGSSLAQIGCSTGSQGTFEGRIFEIITCSSKNSSTERTNVKAQMATAYGV